MVGSRSHLESSRLSASASAKGNKTSKRLTCNTCAPPSHPKILQYVPMGSINPSVDAAISNSNLETLVERKMAEVLTLDAQTCCHQFGDLENNPKQLVTLPLSLGCWGSIGAMMRTTDEALRMLQSADRYQRNTITISGNYAEVAQTFTFNKPHRCYSKRTHLFYNTFFWI